MSGGRRICLLIMVGARLIYARAGPRERIKTLGYKRNNLRMSEGSDMYSK